MSDKMHYEEDDVIRSEAGSGLSFSEVARRHMSRREMIGSTLAFGIALQGFSLAKAAPEMSATGLDFVGIPPSTASDLVVAPNYRADVVIRWGDPLMVGQATDVKSLSAAQQSKAFGYNNDFLGYHPLPYGSDSSDHGLLSANFEYSSPEMMFPVEDYKNLTEAQTDVCLEAVGFGVVEIRRRGKNWEYLQNSPLNKRYSATTPMAISGPAAGLTRMRTSKHRTGRTATGTLANCAAGKTPWGTVLSAEENFQSMFGNARAITGDQAVRSANRYGLGMEESEMAWERHYDRFDCGKEPNEANHFGWVVEFDPYDPDWMPVKRTALGRMRHEAATTHVTKDDRVVMYSGDDSRFEYVYKFVCTARYNKRNRLANRDLMDNGTLYVAKFNEDGSGEWMPLVFGQGPLTRENGFKNQGDVVIDARIAGDLLGATKMDRPEDIEVNPVNQKVYIVCTNNSQRGTDGKPGPNHANPRSVNRHGHIIELIEDDNDHASTEFTWGLFLVCGDPQDAGTYYAGYPKDKVSPISCPDNICFDARGNLWISTDGQEGSLEVRDGFFAVPTEGPERGYLRQFFASVEGSEVCGPEFTPDGTTAFLAIQHPGEGSTFADPVTSWPTTEGIPRPSVIAIQADNGDVVGSLGRNS